MKKWFNHLDCLKAIKKKDLYTFGHCVRVAFMADRLSEKLGLSEEERKEIREAALVHDIGKVMIPNEILNKPGKLDSEELAIMQSHAEKGLSYLEDNYIDVPKTTKDVVVGHHVGADRSGYPLQSSEVTMAQKIVTVCDIFDAVASKRKYRTEMVPIANAVNILRTDGKCDSAIAEVFINKVLPLMNIDWEKTDIEALPLK